MSEAPKKISIPISDIPYIRADLVDELVEALAGVLPFTLVGGSDVAWAAIYRAIKALEKMKEEECSTQ